MLLQNKDHDHSIDIFHVYQRSARRLSETGGVV